ncbi:uncharacterized protein N7496_006080 [Penicillium cataractarum]|uniref:C2H2-type domain-containing protein n=1 Tax=Penicillium cataractarum TaxID=2100454 RepID=A0A9W9S5J0_9EURO|nr:uncharacterized protein N7496_006080 [Penicillium cataractarum]KAJ5369988.1 hypothetical protein N7496_006080 [Penicillium cataractarum]
MVEGSHNTSPRSPAPLVPPGASGLGFGGRKSVREFRGDRDPPKNIQGQFFCNHNDCKTAPPTFRRPGEWNKHMDKHYRPYKCYESGCEKIRGFTHSGGLWRHRREVHKTDKTEKPLLCPHPECYRSTGNGFTRQENLREHLRRRHAATEDGSAVRTDCPPATALKRKRKQDSPDEENRQDLHKEVKQLRREAQQISRRLEQLESELALLQKGITKPPMPKHLALRVFLA